MLEIWSSSKLKSVIQLMLMESKLPHGRDPIGWLRRSYRELIVCKPSRGRHPSDFEYATFEEVLPLKHIIFQCNPLYTFI
ncbi:hypothetical protein BHM03_00053257 [Ensete ventricosum]|nr:hypothetical protein BHM03_00053257 [Ensete ventricosum]